MDMERLEKFLQIANRLLKKKKKDTKPWNTEKCSSGGQK